jgi:hypothetical protein
MSRSLLSVSILMLSSLAGRVDAQPLEVRAPIVGVVHHGGSRALRPLFGVPGSVRLGPPIITGVDSASIAPGGKWAFITTDGRAQLIRGLSDLTPMESAGQGLIDAVDRVVWNRAGSFAVLYSSSTRQLQRVRLSDTEASPDPPVSIVWGEVTSLAIDNGGRQIAVGVTDFHPLLRGKHSGLYLWRTGQASPAPLPAITEPGAVAFDDDGRLYAVDIATPRILRFDSSLDASEFASLAETDGPPLRPVGLAVSKDGRYLLVADGPTRAVRVYETTSGTLTRTISLDFAPTRFEPLSSEPSFVLNEPGTGEWLLILHAGDVPTVAFVPADQEEAQ